MAKATTTTKSGKAAKTSTKEAAAPMAGKKGKALPTVAQLDAMKMAIPVVIDGQSMIGGKRTFKKGSVGYNVSGKVVIDGLICQVSCNVIVVGSKELAEQTK